MTVVEVSPLATVVLDSSGNGQCSLGPPSGTRWALRLATLAVSTAAKQPQASLYRGSASGPIELVDFTFNGSAASSGKVGGAIYYPGQLLWAKWTGGDVGATATLQVFGQQGVPSDPLLAGAGGIGEGFADNVVAQLIAGAPAGSRIVIGSQIPTELQTFYTNNIGAAILMYNSGSAAYGYIATQITNGAIVFGAVTAAGSVAEVFRIAVQAAAVGDWEAGVASAVRLAFLHGSAITLAAGTLNGVATSFVSDVPLESSDPVNGGGEPWHSATFANLWTGTLKYAKVPIGPGGSVFVIASMTPGTKGDGTTINTALPAAYRPSSTQNLPGTCDVMAGGAAQSPHFAVFTDGTIRCEGYGSATNAGICGLYPLGV